MPRDAFAACMTLASREYEAELDCRRLGLHPYLAQQRKSRLLRGGTKPMMRSVVLFPRYFFLPLAEARVRQLHHVRGLSGHRHLLASAEGRIWECPGDIIFEIAKAENAGLFDEVPPELGDRVKLRGNGVLSTMELLVSCLDTTTAQLFSPMLGGSRVKAEIADLTRVA
jgi:hypothetical protein